MNYIQRLVASAAPWAPGPVLTIASPTAASSPVVAADQRLGVFPGLIDPFGAPMAAVETPEMHGEVASPGGPRPAPTLSGPETDAGPARHDTGDRPAHSGRSESQVRIVRPHRETAAPIPPMQPADQIADPQPMSPLQRLVERAPLPDRPASAPVEPARMAEPPIPTQMPAVEPAHRVESTPQAAPARPIDSSEPRTPPPPPLFHDPTAITPDQFTPVGDLTQSVDPARRSMEPAAPPAMQAEPAIPVPPPAPQLQPATDEGPSPFARQPELPPAPDARAGQANTPAPPPERVIERIREVPVMPPTPPKAMTAATQSVIGSLAQRRAGRWQPRLGGF